MRGPNFLLAGAAKAGTTALCHMLGQHPEVFVAREKESHHFLFDAARPSFRGPGDHREFNAHVIGDRERYLACFDRAGPARAVGEGSVYYLYRPESLVRALRFRGDMRFVVVLREPAARAFSAWSHHRRDAWEPHEAFGAGLAAEPDRIASGWSFGWHYRAVSDYLPQLQAVQSIVPPEQLLLVDHDQLRADPGGELARIFTFLGVDPTAPIDTSVRFNVSGTPRSARLNRALSRSGPVKRVVKAVLPAGAGVVIKQRLRNLNLARTAVPDVVSSLRLGPAELTALRTATGLELAGWG